MLLRGVLFTPLCPRLLLRYAVNISAAIHNLPCVYTDNIAGREDFLQLSECQSIIDITLLRHDYTSVYYKEINI